MALCVAATGVISVSLAIQGFTLGWTHSIEKIRWEEDWQLRQGELVLSEARIRGTGAGMEPPTEAQLINGVWHYKPALEPLGLLRLTQSPHTAGYEICYEGNCQLLADLLPGIAEQAVIELRACP